MRPDLLLFSSHLVSPSSYLAPERVGPKGKQMHGMAFLIGIEVIIVIVEYFIKAYFLPS